MAKKKVSKKTVVQIKIKDIKMVPVGDIVPHPKNPNIHTDKQIEELAELIKHHGFNTPLVVSKRTGFLNKGEGRWRAAQLIGMALVPVSFQDFENDSKEFSSMVSDNEIAKASKIDLGLVKLEMKALKIDPVNLGFDDVSKLVDVKGHKREVGGSSKEEKEEKIAKIECPECGHKF